MCEIIQIIKSEQMNVNDLKFFPLPWKHDAICFNFVGGRKEYREKIWFSDILDEELEGMKHDSFSKVECVIIRADDVRDFSFLNMFHNLKQLYIYYSEVDNLSFIENLLYLKQICIYNFTSENLTPLVNLINKKSMKYQEANAIRQSNESVEYETQAGFEARMKLFIEGIYLGGEKNEKILEQSKMLLVKDICPNDVYVCGKSFYRSTKLKKRKWD